jgi:hypothetical protein
MEKNLHVGDDDRRRPKEGAVKFSNMHEAMARGVLAHCVFQNHGSACCGSGSSPNLIISWSRAMGRGQVE